MIALDLREQSRAAAPAVHAAAGLDAAAIATWRGRMIHEYASSRVFEALAAQLAGAGFSGDDIRACEGFAEEERRHGVLCGAVVEALGGRALAELPEPASFPMHTDVSHEEGVLRNLLSVCCLAETVAVSLIGAEREEMPEGELRELLTRIWADEIGHARFGWRMVASRVPQLDVEARDRLGAYLQVAFGHLEAHELAHLPLTDGFGDEGAALGLCSGRAARALFSATVTDIIVPRLESLGLEAGRAWRQRWSQR